MKQSWFKRFLAVLSGILTLALLAGCASSGTPAASAPDASASATSSAPTASAAAPDASAAADAGEMQPLRTVKVFGKDRRFDIATLTMAEREGFYTWEAIEQLLTDAGIACEFELVPKEQYKLVLQTRLASATDLPDVMLLTDLTDGEALDLAGQGLLVDVRAAIDEYSNGNIMTMWDKHWPQVTKLLTTPDGKMYWFPGLSYSLQNGEPWKGSSRTVNYRLDWANDLGLAEPTTAEEMYQMAKAMRDQDANGNGVNDEIIVTPIENFGNGIAQFYGLAPSFFHISDKTNQAVTPWTQPGIVPYIEYMQRLINEGLLDPSMIGATDQARITKYAENVTSIYYEWIGNYHNDHLTGDPDCQIVPLLIPGVEGIEPSIQRSNASLVTQKYGISSSCQDISAAIALFDALYTDEYAELSMWGVEGKYFKWEGDRKVPIYPNYSDEQYTELKINVGHHIVGHTVFPIINISDEWDDDQLASGVPEKALQYKHDIQALDNDYSDTMPLAMPADEELATLDQYQVTLETYSGELLTNLILGNTPLSELDASIEEMRGMGLDEVLKVYQDRHDRFMAN